jgi:hypothetical protein
VLRSRRRKELYHLVEPEPQRVAAPDQTVAAPNLMFNIGGLSNMSLTIAVSYFLKFYINLNQKKPGENHFPNNCAYFCLFKKVALVYCRVRAKAASKLLPMSRSIIKNDAAPQL